MSYVYVRNELTLIGHVILRGTRIVIPEKMRQSASLGTLGPQRGCENEREIAVESVVARCR